jgi:glycosyltransferase involved in cell wall biosynthesis
VSIENLRGLNILVISPNEWGDMRVSKHHYATALARRGNRVVFLNPPNAHASHRLRIEQVEGIEGLSTVTYRPYVPFVIRFRSRRLFNVIAAAHVRWLLRTIGVRFDMVWCFDVNLYSDLRWFRAPLKIFHPVDQVLYPYQVDVAANADIVLSVSDEILDKMRQHGTPQLRIEHGLASEFVALALQRVAEMEYQRHEPIRVGYVGNLLIPSVDREVLLELIATYEQVEFHFWGPRSAQESNVGGENSRQSVEFIRTLEARPNVVLRGPQPPALLAQQIGDVDLLLMCYSVARDPNRGCNSHKILEYMSTGRAIVANHVADYANKHGLIEMMSFDGNGTMVDLFSNVLSEIDRHNGPERRLKRLAYALDNSYEKQIDRIGVFAAQLSGLALKRERSHAGTGNAGTWQRFA